MLQLYKMGPLCLLFMGENIEMKWQEDGALGLIPPSPFLSPSMIIVFDIYSN